MGRHEAYDGEAAGRRPVRSETMARTIATERPAGFDRTSRSLRLADGRQIGFAEYGDPQGLPVLAMHGTPGSRFMFALTDQAARAEALRIVAPERPGYGLSDFRRKDVLGAGGATT